MNATLHYSGLQLRLDMNKRYSANGQVVIEAITSEGEPFATISKCLSAEKVPHGHTFIDSNNLPDIVEALVSQGIAELTSKSAVSGFCTYPLVRIL